jgi:hypothetical protein
MSGRRQQLAREVRARLQQNVELEWCPLPGWAFGSDVDILLPIGPRGDDIRLAAKTTRAEYLAAIQVSVEATGGDQIDRRYLDPVMAEKSWQRFLLYRDQGDHGLTCRCSDTCRSRHPAPPPRTSADL